MARLWSIPSVDMLVCRYTLDEVTRHLKEPSQRARLWALVYRSHFVPDAVTASLPEGIRLVEKDVPILLTAIDAGADVLVTGDRRHFRHLFGTIIGGVSIEPFEDCRDRFPDVFDDRERTRP